MANKEVDLTQQYKAALVELKKNTIAYYESSQNNDLDSDDDRLSAKVQASEQTAREKGVSTRDIIRTHLQTIGEVTTNPLAKQIYFTANLKKLAVDEGEEAIAAIANEFHLFYFLEPVRSLN